MKNTILILGDLNATKEISVIRYANKRRLHENSNTL